MAKRTKSDDSQMALPLRMAESKPSAKILTLVPQSSARAPTRNENALQLILGHANSLRRKPG